MRCDCEAHRRKEALAALPTVRKSNYRNLKSSWSFKSQLQAWAFNNSSRYKYRGYLTILSTSPKSLKFGNAVTCVAHPYRDDCPEDEIHVVSIRLTRSFAKTDQPHSSATKSPVRLEILDITGGRTARWSSGLSWLHDLTDDKRYHRYDRVDLEVTPKYQSLASEITVRLDKPFPLMNMPPELRMQVFQLVKSHKCFSRLPRCETIRYNLRVATAGYVSPMRQEYKSMDPQREHIQAMFNLLLVNRKIYEEIRYYLYSRSTFFFSSVRALRIFFTDVGSHNVVLIKRMEFCIQIPYERCSGIRNLRSCQSVYKVYRAEMKGTLKQALYAQKGVNLLTLTLLTYPYAVETQRHRIAWPQFGLPTPETLEAFEASKRYEQKTLWVVGQEMMKSALPAEEVKLLKDIRKDCD